MKEYILYFAFFFVSGHTKLLGQQKSDQVQLKDTSVFLSDNCRWDSIGGNRTTNLKNKKGFVYNRFGSIIINIKGIAYNPCNLPPNLVGRKILLSGVIFKNIKTDGKAIRITKLQIITDD